MSAVLKKLAAPFQTVFLEGALLFAIAIASISVTQLLVSRAGTQRMVMEDLRDNALQITGFVTDEAAGAVRFGKAELLGGLFAKVIENSEGDATGAIALDGGGAVMAELAGPSQAQLTEVARQALAEGVQVVSEDGMNIAVPVTGKDGTVSGAVALSWSPEAVMAAVNANSRRTMTFAGGLFVVVLGVAVFLLWLGLARPLRSAAGAMRSISGGDYSARIPSQGRGDEIGMIARTLADLATAKQQGEAATREAVVKGAGFEGSSAALAMTDEAFRITNVNPAFRKLRDDLVPGSGDPIGTDFDPFGAVPQDLRHRIADPARLPLHVELRTAGRVLALDVNAIRDAEGALVGHVVEWQDVTEIARSTAILAALDGSQLRAEFDAAGKLTSVNPAFAALAGRPAEALAGAALTAMLQFDGTAGDASVSGRFRLVRGEGPALIDGVLSPIKSTEGELLGHVLIGSDVTAAQAAIEAAEAQRATMQAAQERVVETLSAELDRLSQGDLTSEIHDTFAEDYERLRLNYNSALANLREAMGTVLENAGSITAESLSIANAADDLSRRTETQAATLEETTAALNLITSNTRGAADGARKANQVVTAARTNADSSGKVIRDAVAAMGEIESSSGRIAQIIDVIDDISFQTNLLALNAGVEAARAGEAGRGFAVVAAEVRALAQRSSDAAREIGALISSSGEQVDRGVGLVRDAGQALEAIVASITEISSHVAGITAAAEEQSVSLDEISVAMQQLDEVTQKNAAMFEETTAASHALTQEAEVLNRTMSRFRTGADAVSGSGSEAFRHALG